MRFVGYKDFFKNYNYCSNQLLHYWSSNLLQFQWKHINTVSILLNWQVDSLNIYSDLIKILLQDKTHLYIDTKLYQTFGFHCFFLSLTVSFKTPLSCEWPCNNSNLFVFYQAVCPFDICCTVAQGGNYLLKYGICKQKPCNL